MTDMSTDEVVRDLRREQMQITSAVRTLRRDLDDDPRLLPTEAQIARGEARLRRIEVEIEELEGVPV